MAAAQDEDISKKRKMGADDIPHPVASLMSPGECVFGEEWTSADLLSKVSISHDTRVFTFSLPDPEKPLGLSTCACLLARGGDAIRPYTPISTNALIGQFKLMVKVYPEGALSQQMDSLEVGQSLEFKHIPFNVKIQYPFQAAKIGIIAGGTGVTPMLQALHAILGSSGDTTEVSMLYGSRTKEDILAKEVLDMWASASGGRLVVTHVLSDEPADSEWDGPRGFIGADLVSEHMPEPSDESLIFVCGPPPMYNALCGPRGADAAFTGVLAEMGYVKERVIKF